MRDEEEHCYCLEDETRVCRIISCGKGWLGDEWLGYYALLSS